jgi:tetratricopeptide (TPR) repeat protein
MLPSRASKAPHRLQRCTIGAAFIFALWGTAIALGAPRSSDPTNEHDQCVADAETDPQAALARAKQWSNSGGGFEADHCAAMALFDMKHYTEAARLFEKLASGLASVGIVEQAHVYDQAGQAWLVANQARAAKADFDAALRLTPNDPDLLIDRAEALAGAQEYWSAIDDLNRASELAPKKAEIYVYRAAAYRAVDALPLARQDIDHNLKLAPDNPVGLLERGNIRRLQGDVAGARRDWISVTKVAPGSSEAASANENLARLGKIREQAFPRKDGDGPS